LKRVCVADAELELEWELEELGELEWEWMGRPDERPRLGATRWKCLC